MSGKFWLEPLPFRHELNTCRVVQVAKHRVAWSVCSIPSPFPGAPPEGGGPNHSTNNQAAYNGACDPGFR
jgi:hypothetical protein